MAQKRELRMYEPKKTPGGFDWATDTARNLAAGAATSSKAAKLQKIVDDYRARYPDGTPQVASEVGPEQRKAAPVVATLKRTARGETVEASSRDGYLGVVSRLGGV